jgi:hypothetical protein
MTKMRMMMKRRKIRQVHVKMMMKKRRKIHQDHEMMIHLEQQNY